MTILHLSPVEHEDNFAIYNSLVHDPVYPVEDYREITRPEPAAAGLNLNQWITFPSHNSGWRFAYEQIRDVHHENGLLVDDFIERTFSWGQAPLKFKHFKVDEVEIAVPYSQARRTGNTGNTMCFQVTLQTKGRTETLFITNKNERLHGMSKKQFAALPKYYKRPLVYRCPWVGFWHNPPEARVYLSKFATGDQITHCPEYLLKRANFLESLKTCRGLFVFSANMKNWLTAKLRVLGLGSIPIHALYHPIKFGPLFSMEAFRANSTKQLLQIGSWLRNTNLIFELPADIPGYQKTWICRDRDALFRTAQAFPKGDRQGLLDVLKDFQEGHPYPLHNKVDLVSLSSEEYERALTQNIVLTEVFGSSCNNGILECIASATPLLVNKLDAVREYLGEEYPFYYTTKAELLAKSVDLALIERTHVYLLTLPTRHFITGDYFRKAFLSLVLPDPQPIDFVFTWVNSDDPAWAAAFKTDYTRQQADLPCDSATINRYRSSFDELKYALRAAQGACGHFMGRVFLVVHDHQSLPIWLDPSAEGLTIIRHSDIIPAGSVYNSFAIEACLHRIPGLSDTFAYLNDDIWLLGNWSREDFQQGLRGQNIVFHTEKHEHGRQVNAGSGGFEYAWHNNHAILDQLFPAHAGAFRPSIAHSPYVLTKDLYRAYERHMQQTRDSPFRSRDDLGVSCGFLQYVALYTDCGVQREIQTTCMNYTELLKSRGNIEINSRVLTLQDDFLAPPTVKEVQAGQRILDCLFSIPSTFEVSVS